MFVLSTFEWGAIRTSRAKRSTDPFFQPRNAGPRSSVTSRMSSGGNSEESPPCLTNDIAMSLSVRDLSQNEDAPLEHPNVTPAIEAPAMQRKTRQRRAVEDVFAMAEDPLGPHEVANAAREAVPTLGIAILYRSIKELVEAGWLVPVATPDGARFETAAREHHHHFFCGTCAKTFDIGGCVGGFDRLVPTGFLPEQHELTISGKCKACAGRADEVPRVT